MKSGSIRSIAFLALALALPASFGASADKPQVQAQLLEHNEYLCSNCLFGSSDYYFCFKADNRILIGHNKIPVFNWQDPNKNYFTKVHKAWKPWQAEGSTVSIRYDDKYIWVPRADGKDIRLKQDYHKDIFVSNQECRGAVKKNAN